MKIINQEKKDHEIRRTRIIKENKRMAEMGRPLMPVPVEYQIDKKRYHDALKTFADQFNQQYELKMEKHVRKAGYGLGIGSQAGGHDPNHPLCTNQLNLSILNQMM